MSTTTDNPATLPWWRAYNEMVDDEKLRLLAFEDRWHFVALLCCKGAGILDADDTPELMRRKVAVKLGLDMRAFEEAIRRIAEVGLIDKETLQPLKWNKRQHRSDSSAERTRKYRENKKKKASDDNATDGTRRGDGDVTSQKRHGDALDTDTDTDTEEKGRSSSEGGGANSENLGANTVPPAKAAGSTTRGKRLSKDWLLPKTWGEWALEQCSQWKREDVVRVAEKFRDYWVAKSGKDATKTDWEATWRNWVRRELEERPPRAPSAAGGQPNGKFDPSSFVRNRHGVNPHANDPNTIDVAAVRVA